MPVSLTLIHSALSYLRIKPENACYGGKRLTFIPVFIGLRKLLLHILLKFIFNLSNSAGLSEHEEDCHYKPTLSISQMKKHVSQLGTAFLASCINLQV